MLTSPDVDEQARRLVGKVQALAIGLPNALDLLEHVVDWLIEWQRPRGLNSGSRVIAPKRHDETPTAADPREFDGPWFSAETAARYMDIGGPAPVKAFRAWAMRHG